MRRLSKSEISNRRKTAAPASSPASSGGTAPKDAAPSGESLQQAAPQRPARQLDQVLESFFQAVDQYQAASPHIAAYEHLRMDTIENADPLSTRAAELFEKTLQDNPADHVALHHLAIIHHGMGYQLYAQRKSTDSKTVEHWRRGLTAWSQLVGDQRFWDSLRNRWQRRFDQQPNDMLVERLLKVQLDQFRRQLPAHMLSMHAAIVIENHASHAELARQHVQLIIESGFATDEIELARKRIFSSVAGSIDKLCRELKFEEALAVVEQHLSIDAAYAPSLVAALKIAADHCHHLGVGNDNFDQRTKILNSVRAYAQHAVMRERAANDMFVAEALRNYYRAAAQVEFDRALKTGKDPSPARGKYFAEALTKVTLAVQHERCGHEARKLHRDICLLGALNAIFQKPHDTAAARRFLDAGLGLAPKSSALKAASAAWHMQNGNEARFNDELRQAETLNSVEHDPDAASLIGQLKSLQQQGGAVLRIRELLEQATSAMQQGRYSEAIRRLTELEAFESHMSSDDAASLQLLKATCHMKNGSLPGAQAAIRAARDRLRHDTSSKVRTEIEQAAILLRV